MHTRKFQILFLLVAVICFIAVSIEPVVTKSILPFALIKPYRKVEAKTNDMQYVRVDDSTRLCVRLLKADGRVHRGTVIAIHGIADNMESMYSTAQKFTELGYNVLLVDMRAHGLSDGQFSTYGYREKRDVSTIVSWLEQQDTNNTDVGIFGSSFGASVALQAMSIDKRITFGIVECPFASLRDVAHDYAERISGLSTPGVVDKALQQAELIARFKVDAVSPEASARSITQPVLHFHGSDDERISIRHAARIESQFKKGVSHYEIVKGAHHMDVRSVAGDKYWKRVSEWLSSI